MSIEIEREGTTYRGIKKLWNSEVKFWKDASMPEYYLYKVPNSVYKTDEHWLVEAYEDLKTLKRYLIDTGRSKDFDKLQEITKF